MPIALGLLGHIVKTVSDKMASQHVDNIHGPSVDPEARKTKVAELSDHIQRNFLPHFEAEKANLAGGGQELGKTFPIQDTVILAASHALSEHPDFHPEVMKHPVHGSEKWEGMGFDPEGAEHFAKMHYVMDLNRGLSKHFSTPESFGFPPKPNMQESYTTRRKGRTIMNENESDSPDDYTPDGSTRYGNDSRNDSYDSYIPHDQIVDTVAKQMVDMLYGHKDDTEKQLEIEKAKNAMNSHALKFNEGQPFDTVRDAVNALHRSGDHHYDIEGHPVHGIGANFDLGEDPLERDDHEKLSDKNNEIFHDRLEDAVRGRLYPDRYRKESYSHGRRMKTILEMIQRIVEEDDSGGLGVVNDEDPLHPKMFKKGPRSQVNPNANLRAQIRDEEMASSKRKKLSGEDDRYTHPGRHRAGNEQARRDNAEADMEGANRAAGLPTYAERETEARRVRRERGTPLPGETF